MRLFLQLSFVFFILTLPSCDPPERKSKDDRVAEGLYFDKAAIGSLADLKNEIDDSQTDLLKLFKDDPIPWQKWDHSIKDKAKACQAPILAFVVSSTDGSARRTANTICSDPELIDTLSGQNVCTLIDVQTNPEIAILCYYLALENKQPIKFPMVIWMSHEACPLASLTLTTSNQKELTNLLKNAAVVVEDIWMRSSDYAVKNSRRDNQNRQDRLNPILASSEQLYNRRELFRRNTRQIISLYDPISNNIDGSGGILPSYILELLAQSHLSPKFTDQIRRRAKESILGITHSLSTTAIHDPLDGGYFYARKSSDWSLPNFSKNLYTQAQLATAMIHAGQSIKDDSLVQSGITLLDKMNSNWSSDPHSSEISFSEEPQLGVFYWDWDTLKSILSENELTLASKAFGLRPLGNINSKTDPKGYFFKLNTLSPPKPLPDLAQQFSTSTDDIKQQIATISGKLLAHRQKTETLFRETQVSTGEIAQFSLSQIAAWSATSDPRYLEQAISLANQLRNHHKLENGKLSRLKAPSPIRARGNDYAKASLAGLALYQATLDSQWLDWTLSIIKEAQEVLARESFPLEEAQEEDRIVPLHIHSTSMIFAESSLGLFDIVFTRLYSLTNDQSFAQARDQLTQIFGPSVAKTPINHSDFLSSCALSDSPLAIVLSGDPTDPSYKKALFELNHPRFMSFTTIRSHQQHPSLTPLPESQDSQGKINMMLMKGKQILGQTDDLSHLHSLLLTELARKE